MTPFHRILFPIDFSAAASDLAPSVREIAGRFHAAVTVLHAFTFVPDCGWPPYGGPECTWEHTGIPYTKAAEELRADRQQLLDEFANDRFAGVGHRARIEDGEAAAVIEWVAQREETDLIVMPTSGHGKFRRLLLGSVTAKVLHDISCPVLTSAHQPESAPVRSPGYRSILCAVELNREGEQILEAGRLLARWYGARLCLVHIEADSAGGAAGREATSEMLRQTFRQELEECECAGVEVTIRVLDASVSEGIRRTAIEEEADLVVVGRGHEKETLSRLWSQLYTIIRESPCPVLSV